MNDSESGERTWSAARPSPQHEIRSAAMNFLLAGGICLFVGFMLGADAPGSVSQADAERFWFPADNALLWVLRAAGLLFLAAAGLASVGLRAGLVVALGAEILFALSMLGMCIDDLAASVIDRNFYAFSILWAILVVVGVSGVLRTWTQYRTTAPVRAAHDADDETPR